MTADLALAADPGFLERSADPAEFVIQACERAKVWLREALEHGDIDQIAEVKSQAEAIRVYTMQKQLGKDAELSAAEVVRRAERGIGIAIRRGQEAGEIRKPGAAGGPQGDYIRDGKTVHVDPGNDDNRISSSGKASPGDYAGYGQGRVDIYAMTDGVPDEVFDDAVAEAKAEGNLSRTNVVRKVRSHKTRNSTEWIPEPGDNHGEAPVQRRKLIRTWAEQGYSSRQMAEQLGMRSDAIRQIARDTGIEVGADAILGKTRIHDSNRIVRETVHALEGLAMGVQLVEPDDLDRDQAKEWAASLTQSVRALNRLIKTLRETAQ